MKLLNKLWRKLVFFFGDLRKIHSFPWITWDVHQHQVEYDEAMSSLPFIAEGCIGLHRDSGFCSNLFIPGFMKHAWIHINSPICKHGICETTHMKIVEAISEGVVKRHALFPIRSDFTIILKPKNATEEDIKKAVNKAEKIVGQQYDYKFKFDIEKEIEVFSSEDVKDVEKVTENMAEGDLAFSCTETVSFCWYHKKKELGIFRKRRCGKDIIIADDFINNNWEIVWLSKSVTPDVARKYGLHEEGVEMIEDYISRQGKSNFFG